MPRYAMIVTADPKFLPGIKAIINSLVYYKNDCELHILYWDHIDGDLAIYLKELITELKIVAIHIPEYLRQRNELISHKPTFYLKFYRHIYATETLYDYDAIAIFDADMCITNNIMPYFYLADATERIYMPLNSSRYAQHIDNYDDSCFRVAYAPPLYSMPLFYKPRYFGRYFNKMPDYGTKLHSGEMVAVNWCILKNDLLPYVHIMPNILWVQTRWKDIDISEVYSVKMFWSIAGDRINSIHGRWWNPKIKEENPDNHIVDILGGIYHFFSERR